MEKKYNFTVKEVKISDTLTRIIFFNKNRIQIGVLEVNDNTSPYCLLYIKSQKDDNCIGYYRVDEAYDYMNHYNTLFGKITHFINRLFS